MYYTIVDAHYVKGHTVWLKFADGSEGEVDLTDELWGPVFEPLRDPSVFRQFRLKEHGNIVWPNGADFAPEFLHERARVSTSP